MTANATANQAETIADLARKASVPQSFVGPDSRVHLIVPDGYRTQDVTDPYGHTPRKPLYISQEVTLQALDSLIFYVNEFKTPNTRLFANMNDSSIAALIDYHGKDGVAERVTHSAKMELPYSEEWKLWTAADDKLLDQNSFARFLEENHPDIAAPNAAELIETARDLHAARNIKFTKVVRTQTDNESFTVEDNTNLTSQRNGQQVELPREFTLNIPIYFGEPNVEMKAHLRWKLDDQRGMLLGIKLWRREYVRQAEFKRIVTDAAERTTLDAMYGEAD